MPFLSRPAQQLLRQSLHLLVPLHFPVAALRSTQRAPQGAEEMEKMSKGEVLSMLKYGADRIFKNDSGRAPSDAELDAIIDRSNMLASSAPGAAGGVCVLQE